MKTQVNEKLVIATLSMSVLLASLGTSMANIALPVIATDFGISFSAARWIVLSYLLSTTFFSLTAGQLGDRRGRSTILLSGTVLYIFGTLVSGLSSSFELLIFARAVQGIGAASLMTLPMAIVTVFADKERTGRVIGFLATMSAIGTFSGPTLGGFFLSYFGWRSAFYVMTILGLVSFLLLLTIGPKEQPSVSKKSEHQTLFKTFKFINSNRLLRDQILLNFIVSVVMMTTLITGPFYLTHGLLLTSENMGLVMSVGPMTSVIFGFISGNLVDRVGSMLVIKVGLFQLLIGALTFTILPSLLGASGFAISAVLLSIGYQLFLSANSSHVMNSIPADQRGLASGSLSLSRNLGLIAGAYFMGGIFNLCINNTNSSTTSSEAVSESLQITFYIAAVLIIFSIFSHLKNQKRKNYETESIGKFS